jgi:hypothetical protein
MKRLFEEDKENCQKRNKNEDFDVDMTCHQWSASAPILATSSSTAQPSSKLALSAEKPVAPPTFLDVRLDYDLHPGLMKRFLNGSFY